MGCGLIIKILRVGGITPTLFEELPASKLNNTPPTNQSLKPYQPNKVVRVNKVHESFEVKVFRGRFLFNTAFNAL